MGFGDTHTPTAKCAKMHKSMREPKGMYRRGWLGGRNMMSRQSVASTPKPILIGSLDYTLVSRLTHGLVCVTGVTC